MTEKCDLLTLANRALKLKSYREDNSIIYKEVANSLALLTIDYFDNLNKDKRT